MGTGLFAVLAVTQRHPPPWRAGGTLERMEEGEGEVEETSEVKPVW